MRRRPRPRTRETESVEEMTGRSPGEGRWPNVVETNEESGEEKASMLRVMSEDG